MQIKSAKTEENSVDFTQADAISRIMTPCIKCKDFEPHRYEDGKMICDRCGTDMGDLSITRMFRKAPIGSIVVRQERDDP